LICEQSREPTFYRLHFFDPRSDRHQPGMNDFPALIRRATVRLRNLCELTNLFQ
jgi:hypothetical protein